MPKAYPVHHDRILDGLKAMPFEGTHLRNQADEVFIEAHVSEPDVRQFLLKICRARKKVASPKINLAAIDQHWREMTAALVVDGEYNIPALFYYRWTLLRFLAMKIWLCDTSRTINGRDGNRLGAEKPKEFVEQVFSLKLNLKLQTFQLLNYSTTNRFRASATGKPTATKVAPRAWASTTAPVATTNVAATGRPVTTPAERLREAK